MDKQKKEIKPQTNLSENKRDVEDGAASVKNANAAGDGAMERKDEDLPSDDEGKRLESNY